MVECATESLQSQMNSLSNQSHRNTMHWESLYIEHMLLVLHKWTALAVWPFGTTVVVKIPLDKVDAAQQIPLHHNIIGIP